MKIKKIILISSLLILWLVVSGCTNSTDTQTSGDELMSKAVPTTADKIEVVHFHGTQQCWSCITVGEYALKTITEKFPKEYENGTIIFKEINGELPENSAIVFKYQASGSSLFVNAIANGQDNIEEDVNVWRYVSNESQFVGYFEKKLNGLLGK